MNTITEQPAAGALTPPALPQPEGACVDYPEILRSVPGWVPILPEFGVRLVGAREPVAVGDFMLSECGVVDMQVIYRREAEVGTTRKSWRAEKSGLLHCDGSYRYTRVSIVNRAISIDAESSEIVAAVGRQFAALAHAEREALGAAVDAYCTALRGEGGAEKLCGLAAECDLALSRLKFETRGGWWDASMGTWGLGALDEDTLSEVEAGATVSGPHS